MRSSRAAQRVFDSSKKFIENFSNPSNKEKTDSNFQNQVNLKKLKIFFDFYQQYFFQY